MSINLDNNYASPGFFTPVDCRPNGGACSSSSKPSLAFIGSHNICAVYLKTGENFCLDQAQGDPLKNGYVRKFKADGTADGSFFVGALFHSIAVDDVTGFVVLDGGFIFDQNGNNNDVPSPQFASTDYPRFAVAKNGWGCFLDSAAGKAGCYNLTGGTFSYPTIHYVNLGTQPFAAAMIVVGTETDLIVLSRDGTPTLWKVNVSGGMTITGSEPLPGITPVSTLEANKAWVAGWSVIAFASGPSAGTVAVLATADKLLDFVNVGTMKVTHSVTLSGIPFRIAPDETFGNALVAYVDTADSLTTFTAEGPSGSSAQLSSTTDLLAVGLLVSADATTINGFSRGVLEVKPNK
jgi:hypothetical protein